jgi:hypothetical protein
MSQPPYPPPYPQQPQQPPVQQPYPYGGQPPQPQPGAWGVPQQPAPPAWGAQLPGYAPMGTAPARGNPFGGFLVGVLAMIVGAAIYAFIVKSTHGREMGYMAIGVAALIAVALAKVGGRNSALPVLGAILSVLGVFFGQYFGVVMYINHLLGDPGVFNLIRHDFTGTFRAWKHYLAPIDAFFYLIAAAEGFVLTRRFSA